MLFPEQLLRINNIKVTSSRVSILKFFQSSLKPVEVSKIVSRFSDIDRATIFRTINLFVSRNILNKVDLGEGMARYEIGTGEHHHLICQKCGDIQELEECNLSDMEKKIRKTDFLVQRHTLEFFGLCKLCRSY